MHSNKLVGGGRRVKIKYLLSDIREWKEEKEKRMNNEQVKAWKGRKENRIEGRTDNGKKAEQRARMNGKEI